MLDFGALEKAQTAIHLVRHTGVEQRGFNHPALRVAAVQHGDFAARQIFALDQLAHLLDHAARLVQVAGVFDHAHRLARALAGAQVLAQAPAVVADQRIGGIEDVAVAAVVFFQLDLVLNVELAHEVGHVANARAAKGVDALVVIAHGKHAVVARFEAPAPGQWRQAVIAAIGTAGLAGEHLDPGVLQLVGVLKLVDQDMAKAPLVMLAHRGVVAQQLVGAQHQLAKIDHAFALALVFVDLVQLDLLFQRRVWRAVLTHHVLSAQAVLLAAGDEILQLLGRVAFLVDVELLAQALDGRELVLRVQDLKALRQIRHLEMRAQKTVAQAVEGANPHAAHVQRQHRAQTRQHLLGGLVGEGNSQQPAGRDLAGLQQPGDARGQHAGLARAGARQDQRRHRRQRDGGQLLRVQVL